MKMTWKTIASDVMMAMFLFVMVYLFIVVVFLI